jgi:hypothetical protein
VATRRQGKAEIPSKANLRDGIWKAEKNSEGNRRGITNSVKKKRFDRSTTSKFN